MKKYLIPILAVSFALMAVLSGCSIPSAENVVSEEKMEQKKTIKIEQTSTETAGSPQIQKSQEGHEKGTVHRNQLEKENEETFSAQPAQKKESAKQSKPLESSSSTIKEDQSVSVSEGKTARVESQQNPAPAPVPSKLKTQEPLKQKAEAVSVSIKGNSEHETILSVTSVELKEEDDSVLNVLKKITKEKQIQLEYSGAGGAAYIEGIDNLYEFDFGPMSGWMFKVNGSFATKSAGTVRVKNGDRIEWVYTMDLGKDVGAKQ